MFPILFNIGDFPVHSYGVFIAVGFLLCVWISKKEAIRLGLPGEKIVDLGFWLLLIGMIGSRVLFVITRWDHFIKHPIQIFEVWNGGMVFYGGPVAALPFLVYFCKKHSIPKWKVIDLAAVALPIAHAFGRVGCLSVGCCYGKPTHSDFGIQFHTDLVEPAFRGINLHPTQIYEMLGLFALFFYFLYKRRHKKFDGELAFIYVGYYSILRSIVEIFRGDSIRGFVIPNILSTSQFISILAVIAAYFFWKKRIQEIRKEGTT